MARLTVGVVPRSAYVLAALATTTDGADRKLAGYGIVPPDWVLVLLLGAEELGEAVFALSLLLALDLRPRAAR